MSARPADRSPEQPEQPDQSEPPRLPRLLLLTDRSQLHSGRDLVRTVAECVGAGLTHVVLRELDLPTAQRAALAEALADAGAHVIAAHRPLPGAVGVQLPAGPASARGRPSAPTSALSPHPDGATPGYIHGALRGRSCHSRAEVEQAAAQGFDYATLSPYAATDSKPGYGPPLPGGAFQGLSIPSFALGGISPANAATALTEGAYGVAVMGAVMRAAEPAAVAAELVAATQRTGRVA